MYDLTKYPPDLNYDGTLSSGAMTYANLVTVQSSLPSYKKLFIENMVGIDLGSINNKIYAGTVRATVFINLDEV